MFTLFSMPLKTSIIKKHLKSLFFIGEISCSKCQKLIQNMKKWFHHKLWAKKSPSLFHGWNNKMQDLRGTISKVPCWHHGCFCIFQQITTNQWHLDLATKLLAIFSYASKKNGARIELIWMQRFVKNKLHRRWSWGWVATFSKTFSLTSRS